MPIHLDRPGTSIAHRQARADLVARVAELVPLLRKNADQTERDRRIPEENITALREAGLFKLTQPKRFGGMEADFRTKLEVIRELGRGCGSTAWVASLMTGAAWFIGMCDDALQDDVWGADCDTRIAGVTAIAGSAESVRDGYRVSGRWRYRSGSLHAHWLFLGASIPDHNGNSGEPGLVVVPIADVDIEDT